MSRERQERGAVLIIALMISIALAGISTVILGRLVYEKKRSAVQEDSAKALFEAFGELAKAEAIVNTASYDTQSGRNLALAAALEATDSKITGTEVAVEPVTDLDGTFFRLVAIGEEGQVRRRVEALIREKESFANYNYFVNIHPLGISGRPTPRGSLHTNRTMDFYLPGGVFVDPVTAADGFQYKIGATAENTSFLGPTDPHAATVNDLTNLDLAAMKSLASIYLSEEPIYDAKLVFNGDQVYIEKWTQWHTEVQPVYTTRQVQVGTETQTVVDHIEHYVDEIYEVTVDDYAWQDESYTVDVPVWDTRIVQNTRQDPIVDTRTVERTREIPVYEDQLVTHYRSEQIWVEDDLSQATGGTAIAGGGELAPGHWETIQVPYQVLEPVRIDTIIETYTENETYISGYQTVTYDVTEDYIREYVTEQRTRQVQVLVGSHPEQRTRQVLDYAEDVPREVVVPIYDYVTEQTGTKTVWVAPALVGSQTLGAAQGVIYVEGNITSLRGQLNGRVTVVSGGSISITGNLQYVDGAGRTAYSNGTNSDLPYEANPAYTGNSVLGIVANTNILYTSSVPTNLELNGSFLAKNGRVGITGIGLTADGSVYLSGSKYVKSSLRRLGGVISNQRPVTTFVNDYYEVVAGFRAGISVYDRRLTYQPPIGFPERLRPKQIAIIAKEVE